MLLRKADFLYEFLSDFGKNTKSCNLGVGGVRYLTYDSNNVRVNHMLRVQVTPKKKVCKILFQIKVLVFRINRLEMNICATTSAA